MEERQMFLEYFRLELPISMQTITKFFYSQQAGEHIWLIISGIIEESDIPTLLEAKRNSTIKIFVRHNKEEKLFFSGILYSVTLEGKEEGKVILKAVSHSFLLDIKRKQRSFQRNDMCYGDLLKEILLPYHGDFIILDKNGEKKMVKVPIVQYEETDWQLINRLASCYGSLIFPAAIGEHPQVYLGISENGRKIEEEDVWKLKKQIGDNLRFHKYFSISEHSFLECEIKSRKLFQIGDWINYTERPFLIIGLTVKLENGELIYYYKMREKGNIAVPVIKNNKLCGISILGTVLNREENKVKLFLNIDENQEEEDAYWYPINRTDWYCMPQIGSQAILLFPSSDESEAYVTGIHRTDGEENEKVIHPGERYMGTEEGKELSLLPEAIQMISLGEELSMKLSESGEITVNSYNPIHLSAKERICFSGKTLSFHSGEQILLRTDKTVVIMDSYIQMKG